jgi:hypothetical protein
VRAQKTQQPISNTNAHFPGNLHKLTPPHKFGRNAVARNSSRPALTACCSRPAPPSCCSRPALPSCCSRPAPTSCCSRPAPPGRTVTERRDLFGAGL